MKPRNPAATASSVSRYGEHGRRISKFVWPLMKHGAGEEWKYQMNALPIWKRPALLTKVSAAAS